MSGLRNVAISAALSILAVGTATGAFAADKPPACAAISFRPVTQGLQDGTQNAGLYRSRFGRIVLLAEVKGGQATNYVMEVNGKRPEPLKGTLPASVNSCLNSKHVKTPAPAAGASCLGERFRVILDNTGKDKYAILFGLQGDTWKLCSASLM
jgi:hypothetical protein